MPLLLPPRHDCADSAEVRGKHRSLLQKTSRPRVQAGKCTERTEAARGEHYWLSDNMSPLLASDKCLLVCTRSPFHREKHAARPRRIWMHRSTSADFPATATITAGEKKGAKNEPPQSCAGKSITLPHAWLGRDKQINSTARAQLSAPALHPPPHPTPLR